MAKKVVCFGEMLWDCFPEHELAGGAPMNVALNLQQLGLDVQMISRLGKDEHGDKLLEFVKDYQLDTSLVQTDSQHDTGTVLVDNKDKENIRYTIVDGVAWDYIGLTEANQAAVASANAFIFGSLGVRNPESWNTLQKLVQLDTLRIFDINLRPPFISIEKIEALFAFTDILKLNEEELAYLIRYYGLDVQGTDIAAKVMPVFEYLTSNFPIKTICITLGGQGALLYTDGEITRHHGYQVTVEDTIGAGDAFLSGFVKMYLEEKPPKEMLDFACALGALVATKQGGTPKYEVEEVEMLRG